MWPQLPFPQAGEAAEEGMAPCRTAAYLSTTVRASLNLAANTSPMKYSARRPTACSRELRSLREQCSRRQSFSAVMFSLCPATSRQFFTGRTCFSHHRTARPAELQVANPRLQYQAGELGPAPLKLQPHVLRDRQPGELPDKSLTWFLLRRGCHQFYITRTLGGGSLSVTCPTWVLFLGQSRCS